MKVIVFGALIPLMINDAQAYLDPGSGSLIIQAIIGGLVGAMMFIKIYWKKIKSFFKKENKED